MVLAAFFIGVCQSFHRRADLRVGEPGALHLLVDFEGVAALTLLENRLHSPDQAVLGHVAVVDHGV